NAEPVAGDVASILGAMLASDGPHFLITSRVRLGIAEAACVDIDALDSEDACALFDDRARRVASGVAFDGAAGELVRRLEGSPLALELAAARVSVLPPAKLLDRFSCHLDLLKSTRLDFPMRHRTLRAVIDGSWDSLSSTEQDALAACSVFRG